MTGREMASSGGEAGAETTAGGDLVGSGAAAEALEGDGTGRRRL